MRNVIFEYNKKIEKISNHKNMEYRDEFYIKSTPDDIRLTTDIFLAL